jgi:hypothetical protein
MRSSIGNIAFMDLVNEATGFRELFDFLTAQEAKESNDGPSKHWQNIMLAANWLCTKHRGWMLFCKRLGVPPVGLWRMLPGFERMQRMVELAKTMAFTQEGVVRTLNRSRPPEVPKMTKCPLTPKVIAREFHAIYRNKLA